MRKTNQAATNVTSTLTPEAQATKLFIETLLANIAETIREEHPEASEHEILCTIAQHPMVTASTSLLALLLGGESWEKAFVVLSHRALACFERDGMAEMLEPFKHVLRELNEDVPFDVEQTIERAKALQRLVWEQALVAASLAVKLAQDPHLEASSVSQPPTGFDLN